MKLNIFNKIKLWGLMLWHGLFYGMKAADLEISEQKQGTDDDSGTHIHVSQGTLWEKLLGGVEDEEVKEVRARHYKVLRASEGVVTELQPHFNSEGSIDDFVVKNVTKRTMLNKIPDFIEHTETEDVKLIYDLKVVKEATIDIKTGFIRDDEQYNLNIIRDGITPRFRIEKYTKRIVLKTIDDKHTQVEFYCRYYADQFNKVSALFVKEMDALNKGEKNPAASDVLDFTGIEFITDASTYSMGYGSGYRFKFINPEYKGIHVFDGHYVITFIMENEVFGEDLYAKYENEKVEGEYENQTPYGDTIAPLNPDIDYKKIYEKNTEIIEKTI